MLGVTPEPELVLATAEKSRDRLIDGAKAGFHALVRIFGHLGNPESPFV